MQKRVLAVALVGLLLPALALASQPLLVRFDGHTFPMRETVQLRHTPGGVVRVHTWSWRGPNGAATLRVSERPGERAHMPSWALAQIRELQMRQMHRIETEFEQPLLTLPVRVAFREPLLIPVPGLVPALQLRILQPLIELRALSPERVIVIGPAVRAAAPAAPARHPGVRT